MHIDRFIAVHEPDWRRLDELVAKAGRRARRLSPAELDELVARYQQVSTHLSQARTSYGDQALTARLTRLVARSAAVIYGTRAHTARSAARFFAETFPAALWAERWFVLVSALLVLLPAAAMALWIADSETALRAVGPAALREAYVATDFAEYYRSQPAGQFASQVTTNNIRVSVFAFAGGILAGIPTAAVLVHNGANVGVAAGLFASAAESARFWGLILPHGLLELTAVFCAGGAGLRLGATLIDPGDRPRAEALAAQARQTIVVVIGLTAVFCVAGLIEGFVTGSALSTPVRVGIGVGAEVMFLVWIAGCGRGAASRGLTGALGEQRPVHSRPVAFARR